MAAENPLRRYLQGFKQRWGIHSNWQLGVIILVFAVTGSVAVALAESITRILGLQAATTPAWLFWPVRIVLIFPLYQLLLIGVGTLFGQHRFFWAFEKTMLKRFRRRQ